MRRVPDANKTASSTTPPVSLTAIYTEHTAMDHPKRLSEKATHAPIGSRGKGCVGKGKGWGDGEGGKDGNEEFTPPVHGMVPGIITQPVSATTGCVSNVGKLGTSRPNAIQVE